jgi:predicted PhzF superfamily epimerase YddE/YHI9
MPQKIIVVDAFTDRPFAGNPAAVCILRQPAAELWMRNVAREMNLAETAFLHRQVDGSYSLRWLTPTVEVDLCGHATLAAAHVLWEDGHLPANESARFATRSGRLVAERVGPEIELDFPLLAIERIDEPAGLTAALGHEPRFVGLTSMDLLVVLASEIEVRELRPDITAIAKYPVRGVIVTSQAELGQPFDFVSRFFAPQSGVSEDPVTGSAHCALANYWTSRLGRSELIGYQASDRGGFVRVRVDGDRVKLGGRAVTVWRGELLAT